MPVRVAVVTDSTAMLPAELAASRGITVVPLQVVVGTQAYAEGVAGATPAEVARALRDGVPVSTSRASPAAFEAAYAEAAGTGAEAVVSVHLSSALSGTVESARLAAAAAPVPVRVVDSRQLGYATGYAALTAVDVAEAGGSVDEVAAAATDRAATATSLFYVDTLEHLRRGGRVGAAAAALGSALAVKPLLSVTDGRVEPREKVRTSARALARLEELAVAASGTGRVEVAVAHLDASERAGQLAGRLRERVRDRLVGDIRVGEVGAVIGAHAGPGIVAVVVAPVPAG